MKRQRLMTILAISAMMLFLMGAEEPCVPEFPAPPFNASGTYTGWFQVEGGEACPMIAELGQNLDVPYPQDHTVWGIYKLDLSCIEVEGFENPVDPVPMYLTGAMEDNGRITIAAGGYGVPFGIGLETIGFGEEITRDDMMDTYGGFFDLVMIYPSSEPVIILSGGFYLERDPEGPEEVKLSF